MSFAKHEGATGVVSGEIPGPATGPRHESPVAPSETTIEPVTGWLCLSCGAMTEGVLDEPVPCCNTQFAMRAGFISRGGNR